MTPKLTEINVNEYTIKSRDGSDMAPWFNKIESVLFPSTLKCVVKRAGKLENCLVAASLSGDGYGRLRITIYFDDATMITTTGSRARYLPEEYLREERRYKNAIKKRTGGRRPKAAY